MKILSSRKINNDDLVKFPNGEEKANAIRQLREPLLKAFDIYKSNVYYGIILETQEQHAEVLYWYRDLCDLKESALYNVPYDVLQYVN